MDAIPLLLACVTASILLLSVCFARGDQTVQIGSDRQLFVDDHLTDRMSGATRMLHRPVRREVVITAEHPWEKHGVSYMVTFRDDDKFRAWYRVDGEALSDRRAMAAYAESTDGIHWHRPKLGIIEFDGSKKNNLVWDGAAGNMAPFKDGNWHERALYMERGILQTSPTELSLYGMENWRLPSVHIRRFTLRVDGFVSVNAGYRGGEFTTKPITFSGGELEMNYSTSAVGSVRIEIRDAAGKPISGYTLRDCPEVFGDEVDRVVAWKSGADVSAVAGKPIRLRFVMRDADLYSFRFR